ncbi:hypothetical protein [Microbulbifer rhizosphaerae]|uniref:Uncharacterized protein n=1 Tax=Microbulbifer rhizosphaerae TaxID=1562603 RepID=A0A7W4W7R8_9GAMM|nr:hypothetical protein [Microbulbifer rhizosphaerae]MBB3059267.1 hypothetical protein [Microbulbifer rhizosphaerae]
MTNKHIFSALLALFSAGFCVFGWAHEGHAPPGPIHELHHLLWLLMPLAIGAVLIFWHRQRKRDRD